MSKYSGDTARAHRVRKQRIRQRAAIRVLREELAANKAAAPAEKKA
ncbi:MAG: hypothetical protein ABIR70_14335 [Bryobacteraceae bacterium]